MNRFIRDLYNTWENRRYKGNLTLRQYHIFRLYSLYVGPKLLEVNHEK